jgi:hypothetical protein
MNKVMNNEEKRMKNDTNESIETTMNAPSSLSTDKMKKEVKNEDHK